MPLLDAGPLVIARELGFAAEEGLELRLHREPSWSALRDRLLWGSLQAAHMLAPMPVALTAGIGGVRVAVDALLVLSVNGDMIGVRPELAERMGAAELDFLDAFAVGRALVAAGGALRIGVPFPISMHVELLHYWLGSLGESASVRAPHRAAAADGRGGGGGRDRRLLRRRALGQRRRRGGRGRARAARRGDLALRPGEGAGGASRLDRGQPRAGRGADARGLARRPLARRAGEHRHRDRDHRARRPISTSRPRSSSGRSAAGSSSTPAARSGGCRRRSSSSAAPRPSPGAARRSGSPKSMARRTGADRDGLRAAARASFRPDLYRAALGPAGADLPGASEKLEGALLHRTEVASTLGTLLLGPDSFHDGRIFDPI